MRPFGRATFESGPGADAEQRIDHEAVRRGGVDDQRPGSPGSGKPFGMHGAGIEEAQVYPQSAITEVNSREQRIAPVVARTDQQQNDLAGGNEIEGVGKPFGGQSHQSALGQRRRQCLFGRADLTDRMCLQHSATTKAVAMPPS